MGNRDFAQQLRDLVGKLREANLVKLNPIRITKLRKQFDRLLEDFAADAHLLPETEVRLRNVKNSAAFHQLCWGTCRMLKDPDAYRRDAEKVGILVAGLIEHLEQADCPHMCRLHEG